MTTMWLWPDNAARSSAASTVASASSPVCPRRSAVGELPCETSASASSEERASRTGAPAALAAAATRTAWRGGLAIGCSSSAPTSTVILPTVTLVRPRPSGQRLGTDAGQLLAARLGGARRAPFLRAADHAADLLARFGDGCLHRLA